ncbi:MAG TPA: DUF4252 domain-containing protein [Cyclobacteriaceae bacterium]|nr:DUF4252 domain-containing protein [Cyclobacteriaceae bacterium]
MSRTIIIALILFFASMVCKAQSKTTEALQQKYSDSFSLFFYNNTLRMINQQEDKEFDEIIKDIEKMKFLMVKKGDNNVNYKQVVNDYKIESFEEVMTSRHQGKNFDVFIKERNGKTLAMLVLVNDDENLFVLDMLGSIALDKVTKLYSVMDESSDIGSRIQRFVSKDKKEESPGNDGK